MEQKQQITLNEFIEFVDSYNKLKGTYTQEEELEIGAKFRELPKKDRKWKWLVEYIGSSRNANNYKDWVSHTLIKRRLNNNKLSPKDIYLDYKLNSGDYYLKESEIKEHLIEVPKPDEEREYNNYKENYIEKQKVKNWYNAFRKELRIASIYEEIRDEIKNTISALKELTPVTPATLIPSYIDDNIEAVLLFSDLHLGENCDNYYNKYNENIAIIRLNTLVKKVIEYCKQNKVSKLHFLNLGDLISGIIHTNTRVTQELDVITQTMKAAELISQFLNQLTCLNIPIIYRSVSDNHSRLIPNKEDSIEKEQLSRIIDWFLCERLKDNNLVQFPNDNIDIGIGKFKVHNKTIMFAHGHLDNKNGSVQNMIGLTREWVDYICLAHYHNPAEKDYQGTKVFINGSIVGTENYAFSRRLFTKPSQKLLILNNLDDIVDIDIAL